MKKNLTELVFILDKSGSMAGLEKDVIGGFNSMINKQKKLDGECLVSCVLFDNDQKVIYDRVPVSEVRPMTENDYAVGGCTALVDALGLAVKHIGNIHKYAREEDVPEHTVFVITTDGMENASRIYSSEKVKKWSARRRRKTDGSSSILQLISMPSRQVRRSGSRRGELLITSATEWEPDFFSRPWALPSEA